MNRHYFIQWYLGCCLSLVTTLVFGQQTLLVVDGQQALQATALGSEEKLVTLENLNNIQGFSITADIQLHNNANSVAKVILIDSQQREHLVYEAYPALSNDLTYTIQQVCEESCLFSQSLKAVALRLEVQNATVQLREIAYSTTAPDTSNRRARRDSMKKEQDLLKIQKLNAQNLGWVAGETSVSQLSYEEKKRLF